MISTVITALALLRVEPTYVVEDLGTISPATNYSAIAINENHEVCGTMSNPPGVTFQRGFVWTRAGGMQLLPVLPEDSHSLAIGINDAGCIVGDGPYPVAWNGMSAPVSLPLYLPAYPPGGASGVNENGEICGHYKVPGTSTAKAILWASQTSQPIRLDSFPDTTATPAMAINEAGQVVMRTPNRGIMAGPPGSYLWTNGVLESLPNAGALVDLNAWNLNDNEWVVGDAVSGPNIRAFLWRRGIGTIELPVPAGFDESIAFGINNLNVVVGQLKGPGTSVFIWRDGVTYDLQTLLDESVSGWTFTNARDINSWGEIVGQGRKNGNIRAYIARPVIFTSHAPDQFTVLSGSHLDGDVGSLAVDDDDYLRIAEVPTRNRALPPVQVVIDGAVPTGEIDIFQFKCKAIVSTPGLTLDVEFFDWGQNAYVPQGSYAASTSEAATYSNGSSPSRFVSGSGAVRTRLTYRVTGTQASRALVRIDQAIWRIARP